MWPSAYSSGTPKLTWKSTNRSLGGASGLSPARTSRSHGIWTSLSYFARRSRGVVGSAAQALAPPSRIRTPSTPSAVSLSASRWASRSPSPYDDDVAPGGDALGREQALDLGLVDGVEPDGRECDCARHVAAAGLAVAPPAVVGGQRPGVDDGQGRIVESVAEFGRWRLWSRSRPHGFEGCRT